MPEPSTDNVVDLAKLASVSQPPGSAPGKEAGARWLPIALGIALAVAMVLFAWQLQRAGALERQVHTLSDELAASRRTVSAYRSHLGEVRAEVGSLSSQMEALQELVGRDPEAPQPPGAVLEEGPPAPSEGL